MYYALDPKDLRFVVRALHYVCKNWRAIGDQLDIDSLDIIRQNYSTVTQCLIAMVDSLLRGRFNSRPGSPASWQTIVRVVGDPAGGDSYQHATLLAAKLNGERLIVSAFILVISVFYFPQISSLSLPVLWR